MPGDRLSERLKKAKAADPKPTWIRQPEILLCPNVPKPLYGVAPRKVLGDKWWEETRQAAYASTDYHCIACGVHRSNAFYRQWLEGHELYRIDYAKGRMVYVRTVPLCSYCHAYIHDGRLRAMLDKGEITQGHYAAVIQYGDRVLREAGLKRLAYNDRDSSIWLNGVADWSKWRLCIDRRKFKPLYKDLAAWNKEFGGA